MKPLRRVQAEPLHLDDVVGRIAGWVQPALDGPGVRVTADDVLVPADEPATAPDAGAAAA